MRDVFYLAFYSVNTCAETFNGTSALSGIVFEGLTITECNRALHQPDCLHESVSSGHEHPS